MDQLRPTPAARQLSPATFVHKDLRDSTHVFLRKDATRRALEPPYSGPHKVIDRTDRTLKLSCGAGRSQVKAAYLLEGTQHDTGSPPAQPCSPPAQLCSPPVQQRSSETR